MGYRKWTVDHHQRHDRSFVDHRSQFDRRNIAFRERTIRAVGRLWIAVRSEPSDIDLRTVVLGGILSFDCYARYRGNWVNLNPDAVHHCISVSVIGLVDDSVSTDSEWHRCQHRSRVVLDGIPPLVSDRSGLNLFFLLRVSG